MSTQQEIENSSTSHEISRFIKNSGYLQKEKKLPKYYLDLQIFTLKDTPKEKVLKIIALIFYASGVIINFRISVPDAENIRNRGERNRSCKLVN